MTAPDAVPIVVMRGGTSRGLFFHEHNLPARGRDRDLVFTRLMGSPHPLQVDGLGGTYSSNSKVMVLAPSGEDGIDIEYEFGQVAVGRTHVDYRGNCGNLTAAVATLAVDDGLVATTEPETRVMLRNRNTGVRVEAIVSVRDGRAREDGAATVEGLDGTGAPILLNFLDPGGSVCGAVLPTGRALEPLPERGRDVVVSLVDVSSPVVFVAAADLGLTGSEDPGTVNRDIDLLQAVELLRGQAAHRLGFVANASDAAEISPSQPKLAVCAAPAPGDDGVDIVARVFSNGRMHHAFTVTGLLCLAAAAQVPGTVVQRSRSGEGPTLRVAHAAGVTPVAAAIDHDRGVPQVRVASITRTARTLVRGTAYLRVGDREHGSTPT